LHFGPLKSDYILHLVLSFSRSDIALQKLKEFKKSTNLSPKILITLAHHIFWDNDGTTGNTLMIESNRNTIASNLVNYAIENSLDGLNIVLNNNLTSVYIKLIQVCLY
jgi:hypothetical protein